MIELEAPDGTIVEFPDGTPTEVMRTALRKRYGGGQPAKRTVADDVNGAFSTAYDAIPFMDEIQAATATPFNMTTDAWRSPRAFADEAGRAWAARREGQRREREGFAKARPVSANLLRGTATGATMFVPVAGQAGLYAQGAKGVNMLRGALTAAGTGALYAAGGEGTTAERLEAASKAARDPVTLGLGAVAGRMAPSLPKARKPRVSPDINLLHQEGVPLTWARQGGRMGRAAEDAATSIPIAGDMIAARQAESREGFMRATVNRALKPIGQALPDDVPAGRDAVKYAGDQLSAAYKEVLPEIGVRLDNRYAVDGRKLQPILETMTPESQARMLDIIDRRVHARFKDDQGILSGDRYKAIEGELDFEINRFAKSQDPDQQSIAEGLKVVKNALDEAAIRQNPKFAKAKNDIDRGWASLVQVENAATRAGSRETSGVYTPKDYDAAVRGSDKRVRRRGYARGEALNQDLARAGVNVLPSSVPDSGTPRRIIQAGATGGGLIAAIANPASVVAPAAGLAGLAAAYSRRGQELATALLDRRLSSEAEANALAELRELAMKDPQVAELYHQVSARFSRQAGAERGSRGRAVEAGVVRDGNVYWQDGRVEPE